MNDTWSTRDPETGRHDRNAHVLELAETDWRCLICGHYFDAASDADRFACGEPCAGKHAGQARTAPDDQQVRRDRHAHRDGDAGRRPMTRLWCRLTHGLWRHHDGPGNVWCWRCGRAVGR